MLNRINKLLDVMTRVLLLVEKLLKFLVFGFTVRPTGFGAERQVSEEVVRNMRVFTIVRTILGIPSERIVKEGIVSQRLNVSTQLGDAEPIVQDPIDLPVSPDPADYTYKAGPPGVMISLSVQTVDAYGNAGPATVLPPYELVDGVPPGPAEGFGEERQIDEEDV